MEKAAKILELNPRNNTWTPPEIQAEKMAESVSHDVNALQSDEYLHIFMTSPYIDCKASGSSMKKCEKCGNVFCATCAMKGKDPYPKMKAANVGPYCGKMNCIFTVR